MKPVVFRNVRRFDDGRWRPIDLTVARGRIAKVEEPGKARTRPGDPVVDWADVCVLPGLINAHDHLELNLFPRLGRGPYPNSYEWSREVYRPSESPMAEVLAIPLRDRLILGGYKNLLAGATTVCHHNPYHTRVFGRHFPVRVVSKYRWSHSLGFGDNLERASREARRQRVPWIIHAAEGVDQSAASEIRELDARGLLADNTLIVHGVAVSGDDIALLQRRGAGLIWCPSSNQFLFGATAPVDKLCDRVPVALGTDSTVSGAGDLLDELRAAAASGCWPRDRLIELVTTSPSGMLRLRDRRPELEPGAPADLLFLAGRAANPSEALLQTRSRDIRLVMCRGLPGYGDESARPVFNAAGIRPSLVAVDGSRKLIAGPFEEVFARVSHALGRTRMFGHEFTVASTI